MCAELGYGPHNQGRQSLGFGAPLTGNDNILTFQVSQDPVFPLNRMKTLICSSLGTTLLLMLGKLQSGGQSLQGQFHSKRTASTQASILRWALRLF